MEENIILNNDEIKHKIRRLAYQIYEANANESEIYLAGISKNGFILTEKIASELRSISDLNITTIEVFVDKNNTLNEVTTSLAVEEVKNKPLVLIDDVLNSGGVLIYGMKHFLSVPLKKFLTTVLVDRNHKRYPIKVDFKGISLSTTRHEMVDVIFENGMDRAILK